MLLDYQFLHLILVFWAILFLFRLDFTKYFNGELDDETKYAVFQRSLITYNTNQEDEVNQKLLGP